MSPPDDDDSSSDKSDRSDEQEPVNNVVRVDFAARQKKPPQPTITRPSAQSLSPERPEKLRMFARLIERGMVMITLDPRVGNTRVPPQFANEIQLNLNFSHRFGHEDFDYDDDGVRASLRFGGQAFFCDVPWDALYGMTSQVDGERLMWPDSFPEELAALLPAQARHRPLEKDVLPEPDPEPDPPPFPPGRPKLRRIK